MLRKIVLIVLVLGLSFTQAYAQESSGVSVSEGGLVSLDFRDADIKNVLQILAYKSGVNIVAGPEVTGLVTIQLKDVPWQQALEVVLQTYGYAYEKRGTVITVTTIDNLKKRREDTALLSEQEPLETQTFTLNFAQASDIVESIEKMKSDRGTVNYDTRTNSLIITDTQRKLELMANVIEKLDSTTPQVLIEAKIIETTFVDTENLGVDWVTKVTISGSQRPHTWPFSQSSNNKYLQDDFPGPDSATTDNDDYSYGTLDANQAQLVFEILKNKTDTNILSAPRIVTLDNNPAQITVGSQYPIPEYTYNEDQARLQVSGWEYMDIGIIFNVTPHVNPAGYITLEVEPRITEITGTVTVENTSLPQLSNQSASTYVIVKDGDTLVIGGLVKDKTIDTKKKVPFFGDIPILGLAFQKSNVETNKTDLMIFITPHDITPDI